jgi:hypothetical protein
VPRCGRREEGNVRAVCMQNDEMRDELLASCHARHVVASTPSDEVMHSAPTCTRMCLAFDRQSLKLIRSQTAHGLWDGLAEVRAAPRLLRLHRTPPCPPPAPCAEAARVRRMEDPKDGSCVVTDTAAKRVRILSVRPAGVDARSVGGNYHVSRCRRRR